MINDANTTTQTNKPYEQPTYQFVQERKSKGSTTTHNQASMNYRQARRVENQITYMQN